MSYSDGCVICSRTGKNMFNEACTYCNGTGEANKAADEYLKNHICQCIHWDRKFCPICKKECHHDSSCTPKQRIDPGWDSASTATLVIESSIGSTSDTAKVNMEEEPMIIQ